MSELALLGVAVVGLLGLVFHKPRSAVQPVRVRANRRR